LNRKHIERQIDAIEAQMMGRIKADSAIGNRFEILASTPGVSRLTAFALLIEMPELGTSKPHRPQASPD
jgi:transposase